MLELDADQLDLTRFERLVREARAAEPDAKAALLREALGLWRGSPLADLELETFAQSDIHRLEDSASACSRSGSRPTSISARMPN